MAGYLMAREHAAAADAVRQISAALQSVWDATRADHADLPAAVVTIQMPGAPQPPAHYPPEWWASGNVELVISARALRFRPGPVAVHEVLHQAAHALMAVRDRDDLLAESEGFRSRVQDVLHQAARDRGDVEDECFHSLVYLYVAGSVGLRWPPGSPDPFVIVRDWSPRCGYAVPPFDHSTEARPEITAAIGTISRATPPAVAEG
jgi:hypothetical protein